MIRFFLGLTAMVLFIACGGEETDTSTYWIVSVSSGDISEYDGDGLPWDVDDEPDIYVCVTIKNQKKCSTTIEDDYYPLWYEDLFTHISSQTLMDGIFVEIWDDDIDGDEMLCSGKITIDQENLDYGSVTIVCQNNGGSTIDIDFEEEY